MTPTWPALARRFAFMLRSHLSPLIPLAIDGLIGAGSVAMLLVIGAGWGVHYGVTHERQRNGYALLETCIESQERAVRETLDAQQTFRMTLDAWIADMAESDFEEIREVDPALLITPEDE